MDRQAPLPRLRLTTDLVVDRLWLLQDLTGQTIDRRLSFRKDGTIAGDDGHDPLRWEIKDGCLRLLTDHHDRVIEFAESARVDGKLLLSGHGTDADTASFAMKELKSTQRFNHTKEAFADQIRKYGWSIGDHTYGTPTVANEGLAKLQIGKYCSIAGGVSIALDNHRADTMTTYPFKGLRKYWEHVPADVEDHASKGDVVIGNDVWIAADAFIGSGVTIGDGAILGAKTIVTSDVPAYAVVVGNPGRIIRYRFDPEIIAELQRLAWWDLPDESVDGLLPLLLGTDVHAFLSRLRGIRQALHEQAKV
jgi:acetyltransferase-like isoleucine patch superfamily enzyme